MSTGLEDRLIIIPLITGIFAMLSFGFALIIGAATRRFKIVGICLTIFIAGMGYCMSWRKDLEALSGMQSAWLVATFIVAIGSIYLCRTLLTRQRKSALSNIDKQFLPARM